MTLQMTADSIVVTLQRFDAAGNVEVETVVVADCKQTRAALERRPHRQASTATATATATATLPRFESDDS